MNHYMNMAPSANYMPVEQFPQYSAQDSRLWGGWGWGRPWGFGFGVPFGFGFGYPFFGGFPFFI